MLRDLYFVIIGAAVMVITIALVALVVKTRENMERHRRLPEDTGDLSRNDFTATMRQRPRGDYTATGDFD